MGARLERRIRVWLVVFIVGLVLSGVTAFPLQTEVRILDDAVRGISFAPDGLVEWIARVRTGLEETDAQYPFIAYGTDWLAFAHLVIAVAFIGPYRDPVRNIWVIEWGMIACAMIVPLAVFAGPVRDIPFWWTLLDISFGVFGVIPLYIVRRQIKQLEAAQKVVQEKDTAPVNSPE
ncbi:hypothetical protein SRB5_68880 [Streptomyces sp. RB5]|uniref:Cytoplasmic membrane protein n=1 Tax=Streptomyces smaragdinus TaxID=2585196 RepID=A0A7K0CT69_9ACTN|nr:hypothetical protein [Streptomyces smaragdinus]